MFSMAGYSLGVYVGQLSRPNAKLMYYLDLKTKLQCFERTRKNLRKFSWMCHIYHVPKIDKNIGTTLAEINKLKKKLQISP